MYIDRPDSLGKRLRKLRQEYGVKSPAELVARLGRKYSVSGILKRERGEIKIDTQYVDDLSKALGLSKSLRDRYLALAEVYLYQFDPWRLHKSGIGALQFEYWKRIRGSRLYRQYEPLCVCALIQTEDYAYEALRNFGLDHSTALESARSRFQMCSSLLEEYASGGKNLPKLLLVQDEEALYRCVGSPRVMTGQLCYMQMLLKLPSAPFSILPRLNPRNAPQFYNFNLFDDYLAGLETPCGHVYVTDSDTIAMLERWFIELESHSLGKKSALALIEMARRYWSKE